MAAPTTTAACEGAAPKPRQKTIGEMLLEIQKRIQAYGPGPFTPEQAQEIERLKMVFVKLKTEQEKAIQEYRKAASAAGNPVTASQVTVTLGAARPTQAPQGTPTIIQMPQSAMAQMQKIAPATTTQTTLVKTVLHASTGNITTPAGRAGGAGITILPQQVQHQNVVPVQPSTAHVKVSSPVVNTQTHIVHKQGNTQVQVPLAVTGQPVRAQAVPVTTVSRVLPASQKSSADLMNTQAAGVTIQRPLMPNKLPVTMSSPLLPSGVPSGISNPAGLVATSKTLQPVSQAAGVIGRPDTSSPQPQQVLTKRRLQELLREIDPREQMDDDVEDLLLQIADDFIESVVNSSCQIAKHRKSNVLDVKDVQLHLERCWNMWIPGFGSEEVRPFKKLATTEAHKQRLALIRKSMKK